MLKQFFSFPNQNKVGDVVQSMLTEAQFQAERDSTWVLMDGRSVVGSDFEARTSLSNLPDGRGQFLRGKNNGRPASEGNTSGEVSLGTEQADSFQGHAHGIHANHSDTGDGAGYGLINNNTFPIQSITPAGSTINALADGTPRTSGETRPKNITVNYFIKINK